MLHLVTYKLNGINTMLRRPWRSRKVLMSTSTDGGVMLGAAAEQELVSCCNANSGELQNK